MPDDLIIMSVERAADGRWLVRGDDGSELEGPFSSRGSATRWIEDRSELDDRQVRSRVVRCNPAQRTIMRAMLDELGDRDGPT